MSVRNNEERFSARNLNNDSAIPQQIKEQEEAGESDVPSPSLSFTMPTEFVELPSGGKYYPEGSPLYNKESIEIRFMTARDEDILTSKSLLKKGVAVDRLLTSVIIDKAIKVDDLLIGDKNAIIVAARITGYGADYNTKITCPTCGTTSDCAFDLGDVGTREPESVSAAELNSDGTFTVKAPRSGHSVKMRLLTSVIEKRLAKLTQNKKKNNLPESTLTDQLRLAIVSVDDESDSHFINLFVSRLPAMDARYLRDVYSKLMPNIDMTQNFDCLSCGDEQELEVPFTSDFFWPKR